MNSTCLAYTTYSIELAGGYKMTVAELIHQLQQFRPDAKVEIIIDGEHNKMHVSQVVVFQDCKEPTVTIVVDDD